jgi:hypothetical protein
MKILLVILLGALCLNSRAEILVYKTSGTATTTGTGAAKKEKLGGYTVLDTETAEICDIITKPALKTFRVSYLDHYTISTVPGPARTYFVFALVTDTLTASGLDFAKGMNTTFYVNGKGIIAPKALTIQSRGVFWEPDSFLEATGKAALDLKRTNQFDLAGKSFVEVVDALADQLLALGYLEVN